MEQTIISCVLEDDEDMIQLIDDLFKESGIKDYFLYSSSNDLLKRLEECVDCIHLLVIDYYLKEQYTGIDIMKIVREKYPYCYVIVVSGQVNTNVVVDFLNSRADKYIIKDNQGGYLKQLVQYVLEGIDIARRQYSLYQRATDNIERIGTLIDTRNDSAAGRGNN